MEHFNNRNGGSIANHAVYGFSFIEIILTIALIGAVITPILVVNFNVLNFLTRSSDKIRSIFLIDALFPQAELQEKKEKEKATTSFEKKYEDPAIIVRYEVVALPDKSPLKKLNNLYLVRSQGTWQRGGTAQTQQEVSFLFSPPQESDTKGTTAQALQEKEKGAQEKPAAPLPAAGRKTGNARRGIS